MSADRWEHFVHGADIGVRGFGHTLAAAYEQAALAMTAVVADPGAIEPRLRIELRCSAPDRELLLVDWLNAIVYEMDVRRMLFSRFVVETDGCSLRSEAWGEEVNIAKHRPIVEIKGATYTNLRVERSPHGEWVAECVVDV